MVGLQGEGGTRPPSPWSPTTRHPAVSRVVVTSRRYRYRYHYHSTNFHARKPEKKNAFHQLPCTNTREEKCISYVAAAGAGDGYDHGDGYGAGDGTWDDAVAAADAAAGAAAAFWLELAL